MASLIFQKFDIIRKKSEAQSFFKLMNAKKCRKSEQNSKLNLRRNYATTNNKIKFLRSQ